MANGTARGTLSVRRHPGPEEFAVFRLAFFLCWLPAVLPAAEPRKVTVEASLPFGQAPVDYLGETTADPIARLDRRLVDGEATLKPVPGRGYLDAVLRLLRVPVSSQLLVYSKTAVNQRLVTPKTPRAIYFNDAVSVAWVPGTAELELAAVDPVKGAMFYVLKQPEASAGGAPRFHRKRSCLACHIGRTTLSVPGGIVRSFLVESTGKPLEGYSRVTGTTRITNRWGGWYVTGRLGSSIHMGNLVNRDENRRHRHDASFRASLDRLDALVDLKTYLSPHSDVVAHLVLDHQLHGQNLITRVSYEHRLGRRSDAEDRLLRYLLLAEEPRWEGEIAGTSGFAKWFQEQGPRAGDGRSLRQLDLSSHLFRYRLSPLVYSPQLAVMPDAPRKRLGRRLRAVLEGRPAGGLEKLLSDRQRADLRDILEATREDLPTEWRVGPRRRGVE
ncbi:MAG TPA: hypothetical protein DER64_15450 [Planctomycetaceae bacterium]|nr:hypothetical protein [Planctomycetaceae bacterium]